MSKIVFKGIDKSFDAIAIYTRSGEYVHAIHEAIPYASRNSLEIHLPSSIEYSDILSIYNNEDALSEISISENDKVYIHLNYVIPVSLSLTRYENASDAEKYGPDRWIMRISQLNETDKQFRKLIGIAAKSVAYLTLEEYKDAKIQLSKEKLEKYLKKNPLISNCKDSVYKEYTVTTEKQNQFAAQFAVYMANKMAGIEDIFTWNEMGKPCIPWDEASCIKWMNAAKAYTKPLVAAQQAYEVAVTELKTKAEVESFDIDYATVDTVNGKPSWIGHTEAEVAEIEEAQASLPDNSKLLEY